VPKHQTRFRGFDDKILSMYARGMSTRDIEAHLEEIYGVEDFPRTPSGKIQKFVLRERLRDRA